MLLFLMFISAAGIAQEAATETAAGLYNEGLANMKSKEFANGLEKMLKAIEIADPESDAKVLKLAKGNGSIAAYYVGNGLLKEKKFDEAMAKYQQGIELNPGAYTCYYGIAKTYDEQDNIAEAVPAYVKAAAIATKVNKADRAEKYLSRAANIIGVSYGNKKFDEAIAGAEAYLTSHESADVRYYAAKSLIEKGNGTDAVAHAQKANEIGGESEEGKFILVLAEAYEAAGQKSDAAATYGKVPAGKYRDHAQYRAGQLKS